MAAETPRLRAFVRRQLADIRDVEDILQETFSELVVAYRLGRPIEKLAAWLMRVARNRIVDRFRANARESRVIVRRESAGSPVAEEGAFLDEWFATDDGSPEASYLREALGRELEEAVAALTDEQRAVFVAHEFEGRSFKELAALTGVGVSTLLGRKHAAVQRLRQRLQSIYDELST